MNAAAQLEAARKELAEARSKMAAAKFGTRAWREAEEAVDWLVGRVSMLHVMAQKGM